jgi:hypothetical protein
MGAGKRVPVAVGWVGAGAGDVAVGGRVGAAVGVRVGILVAVAVGS